MKIAFVGAGNMGGAIVRGSDLTDAAIENAKALLNR